VPHVVGEIVINRPVEQVFDFVADERNEPRFNPKMLTVEKVTPGPVGKGTRFRTQVKARQRIAEMSVEFTACDRPRRLTSVSKLSNMEIEGTLTFDPVPEGTLLRWSWDLAPRGILRLATPVIGLIGRREERTIWTSLKHLLERDTPLERHS
jgi:uncharacterized protein YndB with AHSA1/START domain